MNWIIPKRQERVGWETVRASHPRNTDMDPAFRGFNLPLDEPGVLCGSADPTGCSMMPACDIIAPSNDEIRRSLSKFTPPPEWFDDGLEEQVW